MVEQNNEKAETLENVLKERDYYKSLCEELNNKINTGFELPLEPIYCAAMLISAPEFKKIPGSKDAFPTGSYYTVDDLRQIAEHLLVHCNHMENDKED